jgi:hypothetical protein
VNQSFQRVRNENLPPCNKIRASIAALTKCKDAKSSLGKTMITTAGFVVGFVFTFIRLLNLKWAKVVRHQ